MFGIVVEDAGAVEGVGDEAGDRGRAVHAGQDADVVARADLAVRPLVALEGPALCVRQHVLRLRRLGELVVALEVVDAAIVGVDVLAGADRRRGEADDLAEFQHRRAFGDVGRRHLVTLRHPRRRRSRPRRPRRAGSGRSRRSGCRRHGGGGRAGSWRARTAGHGHDGRVRWRGHCVVLLREAGRVRDGRVSSYEPVARGTANG